MYLIQQNTNISDFSTLFFGTLVDWLVTRILIIAKTVEDGLSLDTRKTQL